MGCLFWSPEIWSPQKQAGIEEYKFIDWYREHGLEDDLKMLKWSDEQLEGKGYIDWYAFEHPQLGPLEGRADKPSTPTFSFFGGDATQDRAKVEWVVHAPQGGMVKLVARHDRAGTVRAEVTL